MNPSRISTPVHKKIDEWFFRFMMKDVKFVVSIKRNRDAQTVTPRGERTPKITFEAEVDWKEIERQKLDPKKFATIKLECDDINKLRKMCEDHCERMLALKWEKVIIVGFNTNEKIRDDVYAHERRAGQRMNPYVDVQFDFTVAKRAGEFLRSEDDEDDRNYWQQSPSQLLHGFTFEDDTIHVYPFDEKLLATVTMLKDRYIELNRQLAELVKPANMPRLIASVERLLPAPAAA